MAVTVFSHELSEQFGPKSIFGKLETLLVRPADLEWMTSKPEVIPSQKARLDILAC